MSLKGLKPYFIKEVERKMADSLVVKAKIKDVVGDYNVAGDLADALSGEVKKLLMKAKDRAAANGRKTIMAKDL
jgi:histone H3/H4